MSMKSPLTPAGIEPATFRFVAQHVLNMFRTLIYPSSGACLCVDELPHRSSCSVKTDDLALVYIYGI